MSITKFFSDILTKVYVWLLLRIGKKIHNVKVLLQCIAATRIQLHFGHPLPGEDPSLDQDIYHVVSLFFEVVRYEKAEKDASTKIKNLKGRSAEMYRWLQSDQVAKKDRAIYLRALHLHFAVFENEEKKSAVASAFKSFYKKKLDPIDTSGLSNTYSVLRKRFRTEVSALRETQAQLIRLRMKNLALTTPWLSAVLFVSGYVHASIFYGYFDIDTSRFFSLSDYLAISIEHIKYAAFASAFYIFFCVRDYRAMKMETKYEKKSRRIPVGIWLIGLALTVGIFNAYISSLPEFLSLVPWAVLFCAVFLLGVHVPKYFQNFILVYAGAIALIFFFSVVISRTYEQIMDIENESKETAFLVETVNEKFTHESHAFLGGNERYIFLLDKNGGAEVIPLGKIAKLRLPDAAGSSFSDFFHAPARFFCESKLGKAYCQSIREQQ